MQYSPLNLRYKSLIHRPSKI